MDEIKLFHQAIENAERIIILKYLLQSNYVSSHPVKFCKTESLSHTM